LIMIIFIFSKFSKLERNVVKMFTPGTTRAHARGRTDWRSLGGEGCQVLVTRNAPVSAILRSRPGAGRRRSYGTARKVRMGRPSTLSRMIERVLRAAAEAEVSQGDGVELSLKEASMEQVITGKQGVLEPRRIEGWQTLMMGPTAKLSKRRSPTKKRSPPRRLAKDPREIEARCRSWFRSDRLPETVFTVAARRPV
jgi:hypothetical protein